MYGWLAVSDGCVKRLAVTDSRVCWMCRMVDCVEWLAESEGWLYQAVSDGWLCQMVGCIRLCQMVGTLLLLWL